MNLHAICRRLIYPFLFSVHFGPYGLFQRITNKARLRTQYPRAISLSRINQPSEFLFKKTTTTKPVLVVSMYRFELMGVMHLLRDVITSILWIIALLCNLSLISDTL